MRRHVGGISWAASLVILALVAPPAHADNVGVAISTPSVSFGLNIGSPPPLVVVPGMPVSYAPSVPANYFVYGGYYYLFHQGAWYYSPHYNGPWVSLVIHQVPQPILSVPVRYYHAPPRHIRQAGPPPWREHPKSRGKGRHRGRRGD